MNEHDFDLTARAWLEDGPSRMSDRAVLSALEEIHTTRQRRVIWPARRAPSMSSFARVAVAAALAVAVGLVAITVVPRQSDRASVGGPSPSPSMGADVPALTTTFISPRNGFSIKHPDRVAVSPATQLWGFSKRPDDGFDVIDTGSDAVFRGASMTGLDATNVRDGVVIGSDGVSVDAWIDQQIADYGGCGVPRSRQAAITVDGLPGRIAECAHRVEATVVAGGRLYLFALSSDRPDARALFDAFAATIDLTPETAVDYPNLTSTFVSPTNGFSFGYLDRGRGTLKPAREPWDPVTQPRPDNSGAHDDPFDVVETGLGAVFKGASTKIPDGVSIDAWVDEYVSPGGCVPRSRQAAITIDGQSGRIAECRDEIQATVVADGRLYLFQLLRSRDDARAFFDAFAATIDLRPQDAATPSSTPSS